MKKTTTYLRLLHCCLLLLGVQLLSVSAAKAQVKPGDILVADANAGTNGNGALFLVNPKTGQRAILSDFGDPAQGPLGAGGLSGVALEAGGQIFVSDIFGGSAGGGALFGVDPNTGDRTLLSDFGQGNIHGNLYYGLAVDAKGMVIADLQIFDPLLNKLLAAVVRIDPDTDARVRVSDLNNPAQGQILCTITDLTLEHSGAILILPSGCDFSFTEIYRVQQTTGKRRLLSDLSNAAQGVLATTNGYTGTAVETSGKILVNGLSLDAGDLILRIDPKTGQRTVLSYLFDSAQGHLCQSPYGLAVESSKNIVIAAYKYPTSTFIDSLFRVDRNTGRRVLLSDSDNPAQGSPFSSGVTYIAVVPND